MSLVKLFIFLLLIYGNTAFPLKTFENHEIPSSKVLDFMKKYGYLEEEDSHSGALYTEEGISKVIKTLQEFGGINQTGVLDNDTLKLITSPRCGVPDIMRAKRNKRYILAAGWNKRTITYFIANWSPALGEYSVMKNIQLALDTWGKYGRLNFQRSPSSDADIIVTFGRGYHGDTFPFDGPGNVLAHAFYPYDRAGLGGDIHFDADENWTDDRKNNGDAMDFYTVALHELGHSLGLAHSTVVNSVMFPYYRGYDSDTQIQLGYDDILGIYDLYIRRHIDDDYYVSPPNEETTTKATTKRTSPPTTPPYHPTYATSTQIYPTTHTSNKTVTYEGDSETIDDHKNHDDKHTIPASNSPSLPYICNGYFDAVATLRKEIFIFKDQYVWRLKELGKIEPGYPVPIQQMFPSLPRGIKKIDAAYERPDGMIVIFIDNKFWVYDGKRFVENSPKYLTDYGLPSNLDKIDAVQIWEKNGKTYFYRRDRFWRYNETAGMDPGYPKHVERWRGIPQNIDAATTWEGTTYFFKDELYWKFDNDWVIVTDRSPLPTAPIWLGCQEEELNMRRLYTDN